MNDLIDRQAAIEALNDEITATGRENARAILDYTRNVSEKIATLPSVQPKPRWIPCNKDLPELGETVLVTKGTRNVSYGRYRGVAYWRENGDCIWVWKKNTNEHVIAWMPMPEPWEEGKYE